MKRLTIVYNGIELFSGDVDEFTWQDSETTVAVSAKIKAAKPAATGLLDMLTNASRQRTDAKRAELTAETLEESDD